MNDTTKKIIAFILGEDTTITNIEREKILFQIESPFHIPELISEKEAALLLGMPYNTLYAWRKGTLKNNEAFPLTPVEDKMRGGAKYDKAEIVAYLHNEWQKAKEAKHERSNA